MGGSATVGEVPVMYASVTVALPFDAIYTYSVPEELEKKVFTGVRVIVPVGRREMTGFVLSTMDKLDSEGFKIRDIKRVVDDVAVFNDDLIDLSKWMGRMYFSSIGENLSMMIPSGRRESEVSSFSSDVSFKPIDKLSSDQEKALERLRAYPKETFYLYGVTGSGKSEVYLRRAEDVIKSGRQVLYLVPEITLTHQLSQEVSKRFEDRVAILHSALTPSQRLKYWHQIQSGDVDLIIGARSSVFAPFKNLGLVIIDEEHDQSYKSGNTPRYHARQVAQYRVKKADAQLIMGSATPSLEAWRLVLEQKIKSITMLNRVGEGHFPKMMVVSSLKGSENISKELECEIRRTLDQKKGVILFLNRRGYSYNYACTSCGEVLTCPNCSVSLTYHKKNNRLVCHTCGYSEPPVKICPECGAVSLMPRGFGTENVEQEVRALFPDAVVERLDTDVVSGEKKKVQKIINDFRDGKIDILLGTQMIAKGLNFPLVSLVGIINADSTLTIPDFRASERTFELIHQVSGRVGRYRDDGVVVIQTSQPYSPAIECACSNDLERFYRLELEERKKTLFPPYSRMINLTIRGRNEQKVRENAVRLEECASSLEPEYKDIEIFSAIPCVIEKQALNYRYHVLLRCTKPATLLAFTHRLLSIFTLDSSLYLEIDVDPMSLM